MAILQNRREVSSGQPIPDGCILLGNRLSSEADSLLQVSGDFLCGMDLSRQGQGNRRKRYRSLHALLSLPRLSFPVRSKVGPTNRVSSAMH
jgi:hypothetical protein